MSSEKSKAFINNRYLLGLYALILLLIITFMGSILIGYTDTNLLTLKEAYMNFDGSMTHLIIRTSRVPRAVIALLVGACLSIAGVLMQTLTKNPMASPSLFGVNSGASFFLVAILSIRPNTSQHTLVIVSFIGATIAAVFVYILAGGLKRNVHTINLTLAGAAVTFLFISLTQGILSLDQSTLEETLYWLSGAVEGRKLENLVFILPYMLVGGILTILLVPKLNLFSLGEETAKGLGQNTSLIKAVISIAIVLLSGASVSIAGPITLIDLLTPHLTRKMVGSDFKWLIPYSAVIGAILLLISDILARFIIYPQEAPVGAVTALVGAPMFIYIARKAANR